jgi:hypothetical protein
MTLLAGKSVGFPFRGQGQQWKKLKIENGKLII